VGFLGSAAIAPFVPLDPTASEAIALVAFALAYGAVAIAALTTAAFAPDLGRATLAVVGVVVIALAILRGADPTLVRVTVVLAGLLAAGTSAGAAIGARIESAGHLLPVAIVSSIADAFSVFTPGAPSEAALASPALLSVLAIAWPIPGTRDVLPILGVGDAVFLALYVAAARKHSLPIARTVVALAIGLAATACVVAATSIAIPALPLIGAAVVIAHPSARRVPEKDRRAAAIGIVVLVIAVAVLVARRAAE